MGQPAGTATSSPAVGDAVSAPEGTPTPTPEPTPTNAPPASWDQQLPDDVQLWDEVKNSDSPEKFWNQIQNMRSHLGNSIRVPGEDAGKEDWDAFNGKLISKAPHLMFKPDPDDPEAMGRIYDSLGRPESAEKYRVPEVEGGSFDEDRVAGFRDVAHKHGLNQSQFENVLQDVLQQDMQAREQSMSELEESKQALAKEWGMAYEQRGKQVAALLDQTGAPADIKQAVADGMVKGETLKWLYSVASGLQGEGAQVVTQPDAAPIMTPMEAQMNIDEMLKNKSHPLWDATHPSHKAAQKKMVELQKLASG